MTQETCFSKSEGYRLIKQLGLHESTSGYLRGAEKQYRDSQGMNSIHAREFPTKFCFHRDRYNPEQYPIEHILVDVVKPEAVLIGGVACAVAKANNKDWKSALKWGLGTFIITQLLVDN